MRAGDEEFFTVAEAATLLRVAPSTVRRWIREGDVLAHHIGRRRVALRRADLARLITPARQALALADALGVPATYDAHYLALAEHLGCELWTDDQRLIRIVATSLPFVRWIGDHPASDG